MFNSSSLILESDNYPSEPDFDIVRLVFAGVLAYIGVASFELGFILIASLSPFSTSSNINILASALASTDSACLWGLRLTASNLSANFYSSLFSSIMLASY
jgi:hypothetical protein